ncbi:MAG: metal-dependent hydrolase [Acidobacteria bacterium]|nr:metal-dependent hydrolase [Acidobacteriota bacterium]MBV9435095.1 metal-dependent hydrolase [Acidobacteriota bacterium]
MEPVTHFLTGACLGRAGLNRTTGYATLMTTLAAEFPDIDILWNLRGPIEGFQHHRGVTHSLIGAPLESLVVLGFVYGFHRWRTARGKAPPVNPRWGLLFLFGILALLSHILLDFTNNYGVRPLLPFSWRWFSWDIVFIIEPVMLLVLILGLVLPGIFALVGSEIGARREVFRGRGCAVAALLAICGFWWVRDYQHRRAVTLLSSTDYRGEVVKKDAAMPFPLTPFSWAGLIETDSFYAKVPLDSRLQSSNDVPEHAQIYYKPAETQVTLAAKRSPMGRAFLDWARFPIVELEPQEPGSQEYVVLFRDLRFDYIGFTALGRATRSGRIPLSTEVVLDRNLHLVATRMGDREEKP